MTQAVAYSNFRANLKTYMRRVNEDADTLLVTNADPEDNVVVMSADDYDLVGGVQLVNQIDRMKKQSDALRDKAYDLLADYRDLEKMLNTEINANLAVMNDVVARMAMSSAAAMTPESMKELVELAEQVQKGTK